MKKKVSVGFVLAIALLIIATVAIAAAVLWEDYARQVQQTEMEKNDYRYWPTADKVALVKALTEMGYIEASDDTRKVLEGSAEEDEIHHIADQILEIFTRREVRDISLIEITQAIFGDYRTWSVERKAWWQSIQNMEREPSPDAILMVLPETGDVAEADAIRMAKEANISAFELPIDFFADNVEAIYTEFYVTPSHPEHRRWYIEITKTDKEENNPRVYWAVIDAVTGEVIADRDREAVTPQERRQQSSDTAARPSSPLYQAIDAFYAQAGDDLFWNWPLALRAAYSKEINPLVNAIWNSDDITELTFQGRLDTAVVAPSQFTYGLPNETHILRETALSLASEAICARYGLEKEILALYKTVYVYFDITDASAPLWKFVFSPETWSDFEGGMENPQSDKRYRVEIDAVTGEVAEAEEFNFEALGQRLEYDLKWY